MLRMSYRFTEVSESGVRLNEELSPPLPHGWGRVRVTACGICGTDLHLLHGMRLPRGASYPVRAGHEVAGTVVEAESDLIEPGAQVLLHPLLPCGRCRACEAGLEARCRDAGVLGLDRPGGLADEVIWPVERMVPVPGLAPERAAILGDAGAAGYHALMLAELPPGGALTVLGPGGVGTQILLIARILDPTARLTAVIRSEATARRLEGLGIGVELVEGVENCARRIRTGVGPQDAVIEFGAGPAACREAPPMLKRGGRLVIGSIDDGQLDLGSSLGEIAARELQVVGSHASTLEDLQSVAELAVDGSLDLSAAVSHHFPLEQVEEAFGLLAARPAGLARIVVLP